MAVRLAFAVIAHVDADILIVDEALSVGDAFFTQKCMRFLRQFMEKNTVLFVSHDTAAVKSLCNYAILLEKGNVKFTGPPKEVTEKYLEDMYESLQGKSALYTNMKNTLPPELTPKDEDFRDMRQDLFNASVLRNDLKIFQFTEEGSAFGKGGATIENAFLTNDEGKPLLWIVGGEMVRLKVVCRARQELFSPIVGFIVKDRLGQDMFGDNTYLTYRKSPLFVPQDTFFSAEFEFRMPIFPAGDYSITIAIAEGTQEEHIQHQWRHEALIFQSHSSNCATGLIGIPMRKISLRTLE
ncbi:hypothetical protein Bwad002_26350 [Bilophila wadsworthia]